MTDTLRMAGHEASIPADQDGHHGHAQVPASLAHLFGRIAILDARVREAVERRRQVDPDPNDRFRGLYISEQQVDEHLEGARPLFDDPALPAQLVQVTREVESAADIAEAAGQEIRLRRLAATFGLTAVDLEILMVALAPDLDPRFERLYAYLQDDVSRRRASTGLALELCATAESSGRRSRLNPSAPLVAGGLLLIEEQERPFLTRSLRVPDRVTAHLLLDDTVDPRIDGLLIEPRPVALGPTTSLARSFRQGVRLWYVRERFGSAGFSMAAAGLAAAGHDALVLDLARLGAEDVAEVAAVAAREASLRGAGLVCGPVEQLADRGAATVRAFAEAPCPVVLVGWRAWDPNWSRHVPVLLEAPIPSIADRDAMWLEALDGDGPRLTGPASAMTQFRLSPDQIARAALAARQQATAEGRDVDPTDLHTGARAQNAAGLERLSRRVRPLVAWDDLVLPDEIVAQLREISDRARYRDVVLDSWGMGRKSSKGRGLTALFAGDSGTGKTMSAEVLAGHLGLELYVIDLSTVIDKYVGETEKNLDRIFNEADRVNGVLLFDEADAVFGKRSDVKDSHDRYANVEVAYLLQRMELFDGLAILTTNLRSNLDEAFTRRLDAVIDFPVPEDDDRRRLWAKNLALGLPRGEDIDIDFLARQFKLSGGNIRNVVLAAAYYAAAEDRRVEMADLIRGTVREYRKLGRLTVASEFGRYIDLVAG